MIFKLTFKPILPVLLCALLSLSLIIPGYAQPVRNEDTIEQQVLGAMIEVAIMAFENPQAKENLSQFSEFIKDEYTYQFIIQKIDKFILTNELDQYEDQAEALKDALSAMRELYIESEQKAVDSYQQLKQQHEQKQKAQELKENNIIEI